MWELIRRRVNLTTTVGASNLKAEIERATLADHKNNVVAFNTWFDDTRTKIIKEEGEGYNEYLRQLFRAYLTCDDSEFNESVRHERRLWMQGKMAADYGYAELMELGRLTYINLVDDGMWKGKGRGAAQKPAIPEDPNKFLALATQIMAKLNGESGTRGEGNYGNPRDAKKGDGGPRTYNTEWSRSVLIF